MKNRQAPTVLHETSPARIFARPTADDLWLGPTQESALSHLAGSTPVRALLGPASSGRSTLLRSLARRTRGITLRVRGPQRLRVQVLRSLLGSAGLECEGLARDEMRRLIDVYIRERVAHGERVVIEADDADAFGPAAFSEVVRCLVGHDAEGNAPELLLSLVHIDQASSPAADFIRARQAPALAVLSWMNANEVAWYLHWRLGRFGLENTITPAAGRLIARCTRGCFASVDHLCQIALLLLRNRAGEQVDVMLVREAVRALQRQRQHREGDVNEAPNARMLVSRGGEVIAELAIGERLLVGRSHLNDLSLDSSYLSRHHLAVFRRETGYYVSDLNSVNGVVLNGQRVNSAPVGDGDIVCVGPYRMKLSLGGELPRRAGEDADAGLADTAVMPVAEPAHLTVIK